MDKNSPLSKFAAQFSTQFAMAPNMSILITGGKGNIFVTTGNTKKCPVNRCKNACPTKPSSVPDSIKSTVPDSVRIKNHCKKVTH